jgi:hypothetical protein
MWSTCYDEGTSNKFSGVVIADDSLLALLFTVNPNKDYQMDLIFVSFSKEGV